METGGATQRAATVGCVALLLIAFAGVFLEVAGALGPGCEPITYTFEGSPPSSEVAELSVALEEIERRTGLVFEEGDPATSRLVVTWSDRGVTRSPSSVADNATTRILGYGKGRWRSVRGGRELAGAVVEVDATESWPLGLDRGDGLAAVFVHELGHVLGLAHSPEPTSFMHHLRSPRQPSWTADDLEQLAEAGRQSGCQQGQAGA